MNLQAAKLRNDATKAIVASSKQPLKGKALLDGKLGHNLAVAKGNLLNCKNKLAKCKGAQEELGESALKTPKVVKQVHTTAKQDDKKARGVKDPAAKEKAASATHYFKRTANQKYVHKQKKLWFFDNAPGWKKAKDRLPVSHVKKITKKADQLMSVSKDASARENKRNTEAIKVAGKKVMATELEVMKAKTKLLEAQKPESSADVMKEYTKVNKEVYQCMKEVQKACQPKAKPKT